VSTLILIVGILLAASFAVAVTFLIVEEEDE